MFQNEPPYLPLEGRSLKTGSIYVVNLETKTREDDSGQFKGLRKVMKMVIQCSDEVKVYFMLNEAINTII